MDRRLRSLVSIVCTSLRQNIGTSLLVVPTFALKHFEHGDIFLVERIALDQLKVLRLEAPLTRFRNLFGGKAILDLGHRFGRMDRGHVLVKHGLTQEELAQLVGASRETVNKALADFASRGWIDVHIGSVEVYEPERLRARSR